MTSSTSMNFLPSAKQLYVGSIRMVRPAARKLGLLNWLGAAAKQKRWAHWLKSLFAVHDIDGLIELDVPWWTYRAIETVDGFLARKPDCRVFEFGSGASTIWLARRAAAVISVEHDRTWHALVSTRLAKRQDKSETIYRFIEPGSATEQTSAAYLSQKEGHAGQSFEKYATSILDEDGLFDLIVIDGRARGACLKHAIAKLAPEGLIVFDNSGRARYRDVIAGSGLAPLRLRGLTPSLPYFEETTLLQRAGSFSDGSSAH